MCILLLLINCIYEDNFPPIPILQLANRCANCCSPLIYPFENNWYVSMKRLCVHQRRSFDVGFLLVHKAITINNVHEQGHNTITCITEDNICHGICIKAWYHDNTWLHQTHIHAFTATCVHGLWKRMATKKTTNVRVSSPQLLTTGALFYAIQYWIRWFLSDSPSV